MKTLNRRLTACLLTLAIFASGLPAFAQNAKLELKNLEMLSNKAADVTDITLDGAMLQLAVKVLSISGDPDALQVRDLIKDVQGIYVKNFEFDEPNQYSQSDVEAIRAQLSSPGWSRIVQSRNKRNNETDEVYLMKSGEKVAGVAILVAEARELTVVNIVGPIDLDKLGELDGHFGIPPRLKERSRKPAAAPSPVQKPAPAAPAQKPNENDDDEEN